MQGKKISVCIATYNGEEYIHTQLESILRQLGGKDEVIISDDSSTDKTIDIVRSFSDRRIKIYPENKFFSPIFNFENALTKASGDIIFLSDQDDVWEENKVATMTELISKYDVIVSDCKVIDKDGQILYESFFELMNSGKGLMKNFYKVTYIGCCMAFSRPILEKALPFPANIPMHDLWIAVVGEVFGQVFFCDKKLVRLRRHGGNHTNTAGKSEFGLLKKLTFRFNLLNSLLLRIFEVSITRKIKNVFIGMS